MHHLIAYVKEKGNNWTITTFTLCSSIDFEPLRFIKVHEGTCFEHMMFKACQYTINDKKSFKRFNVDECEGWMHKLLYKKQLHG
jgi:hypothetical protein